MTKAKIQRPNPDESGEGPVIACGESYFFRDGKLL